MTAPDLATLVLTDVREPIPPSELLPTLGSKPFVYIPGTFNTRDLGLVPPPPSAAGAVANKLRPGFAFRSGSIERLGPDGARLLSSAASAGGLGVRRVFDLRSEGERAAAPDPEVEGAPNEWSATAEKEATVELADFVAGDGAEGYARMYMDVLHVYRGPFRAVLEHVRDRPAEPFLFHCTAGRDRTGVLAAIVADLAGQHPAVVEMDFLLSRVGIEPAREMLLAFVKKGSGADSDDAPGFHNLCSLRPSSWHAFVDAAARKYGGFRGYARDALGFSEEDLAVIAHNLSPDWKP